MPLKFTDLDPKMQRVLGVYPVRNPVRWVRENDRIVLIYKKDFTRTSGTKHT